MDEFPMRINKYLAHKKYCTRREADTLIASGKVTVNGKRAQLGQQITETDVVTVSQKQKNYQYYAYYKPRGIITHSPQKGEEAIADIMPLPGVFPIGRLDKDSYGLIMLTNDGRITDALLHPDKEHDKEYVVEVDKELPNNFDTKMGKGVNIEGYTTRPCTVKVTSPKKFSIILTEGKKHQIRRMCAAFDLSVRELKRIRILNVTLGNLKPGEHRMLKGEEREKFLSLLQMNPGARV